MGDRRFESLFRQILGASNRLDAIRGLADEEVVAALAGASRGGDPLVANILATEALNRLRRATAIARDLGDGVLATDHDLRVTFINPAAEMLLGIPPSEVLGEPLHNILHAEPHACVRGLDGACLLERELGRTPSISPLDATITRRDAGAIPVILTISSVATGPGIGRIVLIRDVSEQVRSAALQAERIRLLDGAVQRGIREIGERRRAEGRLRESETKLARIVDTVSEGIVLLDLTGQITFWNHAAETITGRAAAEVLGHSYHDPTFKVEDAHGGPPAIGAAFESIVGHGAQVKAFELRFTTPQGIERVISAEGSPLTGVAGEAIVASFTDITARKRTEEDLRLLNEQLEARVRARTAELLSLNRDLETFAYTVSHDLKAPARGVVSLCEAILEDNADTLSDEAKQQLGRAISEASRMMKIIDDILKFSRVSTEATTMQRVNITDMAKEVLANLHKAQPSRQVAEVVEDGLEVTGDPALLAPLLENLLGNAWKYTGLTENARIVVGRTSSSKDEDTIFIRDNGVGFDMADAVHLFQPFRRLKSASRFDGSGIGLATARRLVARHGGRIWAEGEPGRGATFFFTLPHLDEGRRPLTPR